MSAAAEAAPIQDASVARPPDKEEPPLEVNGSEEAEEEPATPPDLPSIAKAFVDFEDKLEPRDFITGFYKIRVEQEEMRKRAEFSCMVATAPLHFHRNRYRDILPYDANRVVLESVDKTENPEGYINASNIDLQGSTRFIAAQAPLQSTIGEWWTMVEEYNVSLVVMLCRLVEMSKVKCERYWPEKVGQSEIFGDNFEITVESEEHFDDDDEYLLRRLRIENVTTGATRTVHQLHYTEWPDHGCPTGEHQLLRMVDRMAALHSNQTAPVLVHCSAGVGRTGTIIAVNHIREMLKSGKLTDLDIFELVLKLRTQRSSMVQTQDQYQFVHKCVAHYCKELLGLPVPEPERTPKVTNGVRNAGDASPPRCEAPVPLMESDSDDEGEEIPEYPGEPRAPLGPEGIPS